MKTDAFTQAPAERIPQPTEIVNVYAVMKGRDPEAAKRIVLVTGHYDSRVTDVLDAKSAAPGANDDGSGTAVSLECARVLSKLQFPATIIFLTVAAEEQGLNGSRHFAQMAKEQGWNIVAALNNDIVGGDKGAGQDAGVVRVFSEGVPVTADDKSIHAQRQCRVPPRSTPDPAPRGSSACRSSRAFRCSPEHAQARPPSERRRS